MATRLVLRVLALLAGGLVVTIAVTFALFSFSAFMEGLFYPSPYQPVLEWFCWKLFYLFLMALFGVVIAVAVRLVGGLLEQLLTTTRSKEQA